MALVLKYQRDVCDMTYSPQGPVYPKYMAVYICSIKRDCFPRDLSPLVRANGRRIVCIMNSRVNESTIVQKATKAQSHQPFPYLSGVPGAEPGSASIGYERNRKWWIGFDRVGLMA